MSSLCNRMEELVGEIQSSTEARRASLEHIRSQTHQDLDRFRRQRLETVRESLENLRQRLEEIRETAGSLRQAMRAALGEIASDVWAAKRLWSGGEVREFARPATTTVVEQPLPPETAARAAEPRAEAPAQPPPAEPVEKRAAEREQVLRVLRAHPEGIRLVDIGNELGVDWRGLIAFTKSLLDEGRIEKIDHLYYPAEETSH